MFSGMAVWGGVGWLLDHWWRPHVLTLVGGLLGLGVAIYLVVASSVAVPRLRGAAHRHDPGRAAEPARTQTQKGRR